MAVFSPSACPCYAWILVYCLQFNSQKSKSSQGLSKATTVSQCGACQSPVGEVLPWSPGDAMNFTCPVYLCHSWVSSPAPIFCIPLTAASSICQALVFLRPLCLPRRHAGCSVSPHTPKTPQVTAAWSAQGKEALPLLFASLIHVCCE